MRQVDLIVSFKSKVLVDDDGAEHVQDQAVRDFVKGDLKFSLSGLVKEGMEIVEVSDIIFV